MAGAASLRVVIVKPSKYGADGFVERCRRGFMPNATVPYLVSMTPGRIGHAACEVRAVDEYVHTDLGCLSLFDPAPGVRALVALVGVQSHQLHRHLRTLRLLAPDVASFYILTPVPGTEQYEDFRRDGWITETNLDRFDGSCVTWRHSNLATGELTDLLFRCYRDFYAEQAQ